MMTKVIAVLAVLVSLVASASVYAAKPTKGSYYANATEYQLDPNLPEPFSRSKTVQVVVNFDYKDITLVFLMSESEGINITWPIVSDVTDNCNNREVIAAPPEGSTPYYKDFEIKLYDYSENTCDEVKVPAPTVTTLKSYEVRHKTTTHSTILGEALRVLPPEQ